MQDKRFVLLTIYFNYISAEYIIQSDGWVPVTGKQVYNQARREWTRNLIHPTIKPAIDTANILTFLNVLKNSDEKTNKPKDGNASDNVRKNVSPELESGDQRNFNNVIIVKAIDSTRKAKKTVDSINQSDIDISGEINKNNEELEANPTKKTAIADRSTTYEVTEDNNFEDSVLRDTKEGIGYIYTKPESENTNFTSTLTNILSKYNIKTDDNLRNYELSRRIKTENPITSSYRVWIPYKYNSLNHLPVDPLLAVFLSNYGVYLPSLYGIKSNYNNLYGYLASNNIHNNRPFGLYKIFSDTDSWN